MNEKGTESVPFFIYIVDVVAMSVENRKKLTNKYVKSIIWLVDQLNEVGL